MEDRVPHVTLLPMKKKHTYKMAGFTLTELLVVIGVMVVLAALMLPFIASATYQVHKASSLSNLRGMGQALMSYAADHDGRFPEGGFRPKLRGITVRYWFNALDYYMGGKDYLAENWKNPNRPSWQNDPLKKYTKEPPKTDAGFAVNVGYGWNHSYFGYTPDWYPASLGWGSRLSQVNRPAETIIIGTNSDDDAGLGNALIYPSANSARRYRGKGLFLLVDGHVAEYTPEEILANDKYLFKKIKP